MPEAPEVQTVLSTLETQLKDVMIIDGMIYYPSLIENADVSSFLQQIKGQSFRQFFRIGKYLGFTLDDYDWIVHLRMEGKFYLYTTLPQDMKHIHAVFSLNNGQYLCYHDTRKFGRMALYPKVEEKETLPSFKNVGWDCLDPRMTSLYFYQRIHTSHRALKMALLDQSIMAGIGNIYADEICFASGLDPRTKCYRISKKDCETILYHTRRIIQGAITYGGTTIRSYTSSLGITGRFQLHLKVHQRKGQPCLICQTPIIKTQVGKRGTYICPHCQKRK